MTERRQLAVSGVASRVLGHIRVYPQNRMGYTDSLPIWNFVLDANNPEYVTIWAESALGDDGVAEWFGFGKQCIQTRPFRHFTPYFGRRSHSIERSLRDLRRGLRSSSMHFEKTNVNFMLKSPTFLDLQASVKFSAHLGIHHSIGETMEYIEMSVNGNLF